MPLWLLLLVALFAVVAAVALIISIHILETHASQCLALDAVGTSSKESSANSGMAASADHTCCVCGGHRKGSGDLEALPGASKTSGGLFQPLSDVAFGKSTACSAADCLSGLTSRRSGTASGLRSGWLKTSRCFAGAEVSTSEQDEHVAVAVSGVVGMQPGSCEPVATASSSVHGSCSGAVAQSSTGGGMSSSMARQFEGSVASVAAALSSETRGDNFACLAEASAGSWGTCGSSATATITATITATPSATASGSTSDSSNANNSAGKQPPSRRLVLEILMSPSNTPDGQGGSLPRATGVRLKLETSGAAETLQNLAQLTGGKVGGDGILTITGEEEIAALGLNDGENMEDSIEQRANASLLSASLARTKSAGSQLSGATATTAKSNSKEGAPSGGVSSVSMRGGKGGDVGPPPVGKGAQGQKSAGVTAQKGGGVSTSGSSLNSKAGALSIAEGKGFPSLPYSVGDWKYEDDLPELVDPHEDPRAKKVAEEVAARKADMEVVLAAARATAAARKTNNASALGQLATKGAFVKENQAVSASSKGSSVVGVKNGEGLSAGKGKVKSVAAGPGSANTSGSTLNSVEAKVVKTASGVGQGAPSVKQEGLDSLRLSSGELGSKGKVTKDVARGSADFASVLAALNVDSIGGKGAGLGSAIGPNGLVGGSSSGVGTASSLMLNRCVSSDNERSGKGSADEAMKEEGGCIGDGSGSDAGLDDAEDAIVSSQTAKIGKQEGELPADEDLDESKKRDKKRGKNKRRRQKQKAINATAGGVPGSSGAAPGVREFPLNISLHGQKTTEVEVGCICSTPKGFAHVMGCPYPFMANMSNIQRKIKEQYDELVKANIAKSLTLAQVGRFTTCLVDAKNTIQQKSDIIQRRFTIVKSLLSKADKSNFDRLCGQIYGLEREQKQLEEDSIVYNRMQEQLKQSPAYQKMLEYGRTHFETLPKSGQLIEKADNEEQISFEELLAQEKKDAFWQKHSSRSSVLV